MNYDTVTREELIEALEPIGAGGVSSQRITGTDARWYAVGAGEVYGGRS